MEVCEVFGHLRGLTMEESIADEAGRKPYSKPEIIHEIDLEVRAGSPVPGLFPPDGVSDFDS
jgi:hypothetical protein